MVFNVFGILYHTGCECGVWDGCRNKGSSPHIISHFPPDLTITSLTHLISELQGGWSPSLAPEALFQGISVTWIVIMLLRIQRQTLEKENLH